MRSGQAKKASKATPAGRAGTAGAVDGAVTGEPAGIGGDGGRSASTFGPYRIDALIGRGPTGEVHQAFDTRRRRAVALKRLGTTATDDDGVRREVEAAARLAEPHVIPIHDFGELDGRLFVDMRLVEGTHLAGLLRHGPLAVGHAVELCRQVAGALDSAHRAGLVHRDVKPSNILVSGPEQDFAYLIDFGLAVGTPPGSTPYAAPERAQADRVDHRVDIYALCCVLHEAVTGSPPRAGSVGAVPAALEPVLARGLAEDPDERHQRAEDLAADLRRARDAIPAGSGDTTAVSGTPAGAVPDGDAPVGRAAGAEPTAAETPPSRGPSRPWRWIVAAMSCLVLAVAAVVVAVVAVATHQGPGSPEPVADRTVAAFAARDRATLDAVSCRGPDGTPTVALTPEVLALIQGARRSGPATLVLASEARAPVELTLAVGGGTQTDPGELVLSVDDDRWCLRSLVQPGR